MSKTPEEKLSLKRAAWIERTKVILSLRDDEATIRRLLSQERRQGVRLNTLIAPAQKTLARLAALGWQGTAYPWAEHCYSTEEGAAALRDSELVTSGAVYIQNAASWLPVLALDPQSGEDILDVCAAPGGKTSHIADIAHNQARITANDNSRPRLAKLRANLERLGVRHVEYTLFDATHIVRKLEGKQFDKILLDAPCSGEGLMRYDNDKDFATWSVAHIKRLQQLQKRLITQAWELLKPGGALVYSTCTMAPEENEAVIDYLIRTRDDVQVEPCIVKLPNRIPAVQEWNGRHFHIEIQRCLRLAPSPKIEAFFVCKLKKIASSDQTVV